MKRNFIVGLFGSLVGFGMLVILFSATGIVGAALYKADRVNSAEIRSDVLRANEVSAVTPLTSTFTYQGQLSNSGSFITLASRQALTATPYATSLMPGATITGLKNLPGPYSGSPTDTWKTYLPIIFGPPSGFTLYNLSDGAVLDDPQFDLMQLQVSRSTYCTPAAEVSFTLAQARQHAWSFLTSQIGQANVDGFRQATATSTADQVQAFAMAAVAARKPEGALAALLVANEKEPNSAMILVNASGMLTSFGFFNEAQAFLDAADGLGNLTETPMGVPGAAIKLNNRGRALNGLGRYTEAQALLNQAIQIAPELSEARLNMANALLCQNNDTQALDWYVKGQRRHSPPPDDAFDRSNGRFLSFPGVILPLSADQTEQYALKYWQLRAETEARRSGRVDRILQIINLRNLQTISLITSRRFEDIRTRIAYGYSLPGVAALEQKLMDQQHVASVLDRRHVQEFGDLIEYYNQNPPMDYGACRSLVIQHWNESKPELNGLYNAWRDLAVRMYFEQTALASNLADPLNHEEESLAIENWADNNLGNLLRDYWDFTHYIGWEWNYCQGPEETADLSITPDYQRSLSCPPSLKGVKLGIKLGEIVTINVNCEIVQIELAYPPNKWLGFFSQLTIEPRTGKTTVFAGAKSRISIGPVTLDAKEGFYVRGDRSAITDVGMKVTTGGSLGYGGVAGKVDGPGFEFGVADAVAYWNNDSH